MGFSTSLIRRHNFLPALSALGIVLEKPSFPVVATCPLCNQPELRIFNDIFTDGLWLSCVECKTHGDIITASTHIWNISLPDALSKFSDLGLIPESENDRLAGEQSRFSARHMAANDFWRDVEGQVWSHGDDIIACRLRDFGMRYEISACTGLVGVATYDQIAKLCTELGRPKPQQIRENGPSLVYPFYDLPGRVAGFLLVQYGETYESQQTFIPVAGYKRKRPEAGYFMLESLLQPADKSLRDTQFLSEDIGWVLKTQCQQLQYGASLFPLAAAYNGTEATSYGTTWASFEPATRIFHAHAVSPELISRACNARGYVSVTTPAAELSFTNLKAIRAKAETWQQNLKNALTGIKEEKAQAFAENLHIAPDKLGLFLQKFDHPFSDGFTDRVLHYVDAAPAEPRAKWRIIERESGWWNHNGKHIINVLPKIERVTQTDDGEKIYTGTITLENRDVYRFTDSAKKIERMGFLVYVAAVLAPHKKLVLYDRLWNARSLLMAMQLNNPEVVTVSTQYGWDHLQKVFRFNNYEITDSGAVQQTPTWPGRKTPISFSQPVPVAPLPVRELLTLAHENSYVWNLFAGVASQLIAPALGNDPVAVGVGAEHFKSVLEVTAALCCPVERAVAAHKHSARGFFARLEGDLQWPTLIFNAFADDILSNVVPRYFNQPLIARLSPAAMSIAPGYGWHTIIGTTGAVEMPAEVLRDVLPAYIQHVMRVKAQWPKNKGNLHTAVLSDVHNWLLETYGNAFNLPHASSQLRGPDTAHVALFEELTTALQTGKISLIPHPRLKKQQKNYFLRKKNYWWLNRNAVDRYFYIANSVGPNWLAIVELLQQNDIYKGEHTIHNMRGLLIDSEWCDQFWSSDLPEEKETG